MNSCIAADCESTAKNLRRGMCGAHYREWLHTNPTTTMAQRRAARPAIIEGDIAKIPLGVDAKDGYAIVDVSDAHLADKYKFRKTHTTGYASSNESGFLHHNVIGKPKLCLVVDHINRDKLDNRRSNLRFISNSRNIHNRGLLSTNTSGYKGVFKSGYRWIAVIIVDGVRIEGEKSYDTPEEAALKYNEFAKIHIGEYAHFNEVK